MAKRSGTKSKGRVDWRAVLVDPLVRQILALVLTGVAVITLLTLFGVTSGRWVDAWAGRLQLWLGWGAYPAAVAMLLGGLVWLRHQLDQPVDTIDRRMKPGTDQNPQQDQPAVCPLPFEHFPERVMSGQCIKNGRR